MGYNFESAEVTRNSRNNEFVEVVHNLYEAGQINTGKGLSFTAPTADKGKIVSQVTRAGNDHRPPVTVRRRFHEVGDTMRVLIWLTDKITKGTPSDPAAPSEDAPAATGVTASTPDAVPAAPKKRGR